MSRTRIFFSTDIHGSERCFLKFINAGKHYNANVLVLGGDITGKMLVPIVERDGKWEAEYMGTRLQLASKSQLEDLVKNMSVAGGYPYYTDQSGFEELAGDRCKLESLFESSMAERMQKWIVIADQRLKGTGISCFINAGNDDSHVVDHIIKKSSHVVMPEGVVVTLDERHEMISTGYANITPWNCPRDVPEEMLEKKIDEMVSKVKNIRSCIFNFHCPPHGTPIDLAPRLDENLRPVIAPGGGLEMIHAGSAAVRKAIEKYQPLLGLHGHIHESKGFVKLGKTVCINPGSEYSEGILRGVIVDLEDGLRSYLLTEG
jgi:Icc-related predicted phosphoesterase